MQSIIGKPTQRVAGLRVSAQPRKSGKGVQIHLRAILQQFHPVNVDGIRTGSIGKAYVNLPAFGDVGRNVIAYGRGAGWNRGPPGTNLGDGFMIVVDAHLRETLFAGKDRKSVV